nr:helix-turn-helix transcriptional regulator [Streptomyces sp. SID4917]
MSVSKLLEKTLAVGDGTGYAISRRAGISESSAYRILAGEAQPDLNTAMRLAETYDLDLRKIMKRIEIESVAA